VKRGNSPFSQIRLLAPALLFFLLAFFASAVFAGDEQELIYALHLDDLVLSESIAVLEQNGQLFLPIGELASLLNLAVRYQGDGKAAGYILDESRTIEVDATTGTVIIQGHKSEFDKKLVIVQKDDLFVAAGVLSKWFPVNIVSDKAQQIIKLEAREKLPLQQLLERQARFQNVKQAALDQDPSFPDVTPPYRLLAPPVVDFATSLDFSGNNLGNIDRRHSLIAAGDLAGLNANLNLSDSNGVFDRADFTAGRVDSKGELLGPLQATRFALGAVQTPALTGVSRASSPMYGFLVSNRPTRLPTQFSTHDIEGPLPQGWDAELYYNGMPIGYQPASKEAIYRFNNLPLKIGLNDFRLVLHGPNGETRVERQRFLLDGLMVKPGTVQYTMGGNREVIKGGRNANAVFMADIGLTNNLSAFVGAASVADKYGRFANYADTGLKGTIGSSFLTLDHVRSKEGGSATLFTFKGYASGLYISAGQSFIDRLASEVFPDTENSLVSVSSLKLEGSLPTEVRIPFGVEANLERRQSGEAVPSFLGRVSGEIGGVSLSEQVIARMGPDAVTTVGQTQVGTSLMKVSLRGQINYALSPSPAASTIQLAATKDIGASYQLTGQISHDPASGNYDFTAGLAKRLGSVGFLVNAGGSTSGAYNISTQLSVSAGINPRTRGVITDAFPMSAYGGLVVLAYVDGNGNGAYDKGEQLLEGVRFIVNGSATLGATGKDGMLLLKQLPDGVPLDISVAQESVSEPFLVPLAAGYRIEPRPGVITNLDFGLVPSGEVDGMVEFRSKKGLVPVADVQVALMDSTGKVVATTNSEKSGYFLFKKVKGGVYILGLKEGEAVRLLVYQEHPVVLVMPLEGDMLSGNDLNLSRVSQEL
jgi:hypothetical protein